MANKGSIPQRVIAESGDEVFGWDGSAGEEAYFPLRTAASHNVGPQLDRVPRGSDFDAGLHTLAAALRKIFRAYDFAGGANIIRIMPTDGADQGVSLRFFGVNLNAMRAGGEFGVRVGKDVNGVEGSFDAYVRGSLPAQLVTFNHEGRPWVGIQFPINLAGTGVNEGVFVGACTSNFDPALVTGVETSAVTDLLPFDGGSQVASGRGGDAIGKFSPLRNTNIASMASATDFPVASGTWTPTLAGDAVAGAHTYGVRIGHWREYGAGFYVQGTMEVTAFDPSASGLALMTGIPFPAFGNNAGISVSSSVLASPPANFSTLLGRTGVTSNTAITLRAQRSDGTSVTLTVGEFGAGTIIFSTFIAK